MLIHKWAEPHKPDMLLMCGILKYRSFENVSDRVLVSWDHIALGIICRAVFLKRPSISSSVTVRDGRLK